ncbi:basic proline-rich protein-like [Numida meleagris]|uniref:basic proline-rich protein-like n=1 Tax=Numida meleagris TaxID=8996 RepID=UPI000B3E1A80|nr:basic proline-rich protein-like [Numida meleagris]
MRWPGRKDRRSLSPGYRGRGQPNGGVTPDEEEPRAPSSRNLPGAASVLKDSGGPTARGGGQPEAEPRPPPSGPARSGAAPELEEAASTYRARPRGFRTELRRFPARPRRRGEFQVFSIGGTVLLKIAAVAAQPAALRPPPGTGTPASPSPGARCRRPRLAAPRGTAPHVSPSPPSRPCPEHPPALLRLPTAGTERSGPGGHSPSPVPAAARGAGHSLPPPPPPLSSPRGFALDRVWGWSRSRGWSGGAGGALSPSSGLRTLCTKALLFPGFLNLLIICRSINRSCLQRPGGRNRPGLRAGRGNLKVSGEPPGPPSDRPRPRTGLQLSAPAAAAAAPPDSHFCGQRSPLSGREERTGDGGGSVGGWGCGCSGATSPPCPRPRVGNGNPGAEEGSECQPGSHEWNGPAAPPRPPLARGAGTRREPPPPPPALCPPTAARWPRPQPRAAPPLSRPGGQHRSDAAVRIASGNGSAVLRWHRRRSAGGGREMRRDSPHTGASGSGVSREAALGHGDLGHTEGRGGFSVPRVRAAPRRTGRPCRAGAEVLVSFAQRSR